MVHRAIFRYYLQLQTLCVSSFHLRCSPSHIDHAHKYIHTFVHTCTHTYIHACKHMIGGALSIYDFAFKTITISSSQLVIHSFYLHAPLDQMSKLYSVLIIPFSSPFSSGPPSHSLSPCLGVAIILFRFPCRTAHVSTHRDTRHNINVFDVFHAILKVQTTVRFSVLTHSPTPCLPTPYVPTHSRTYRSNSCVSMSVWEYECLETSNTPSGNEVRLQLFSATI